MRVSGWSAGAGRTPRRRSPMSSRCPTARSTAPRCWSRCRSGGIDAVANGPGQDAGASVRSAALVGSHATRYTVPPRAGCLPAGSARWPARRRHVRSLSRPMTAYRPQPRPGVLDIAPYVPGQEQRRPASPRSSSCPPTRRRSARARRAIAAYQRRRRRIWRTIRTAPRRSCARRSAAPSASIPSRIVCGAGSDDLLQLARPRLSRRRRRGDPHHAWLSGLSDRHARHRRNAGGRGRRTNYTADVDAILAAVTASTKIVFLANPNNPTGTYLPFDEVKRLHRGLPPHVLLVLDAAYAEYVRRNDYESGIELVATSRERRDVAARSPRSTGSPRCGSAGCIGPAHSSTRSTAFADRSTSTPPAIAAGIAAIEDTAHRSARARTTTRWLDWLTEEIGKLGLKVTPSVANFLLIHFPADQGPHRRGRRRLPHRARADPAPGRRAYKLPHALRMTRRHRGGQPPGRRGAQAESSGKANGRRESQ